ncbi:MAG: phosphopeptide-binding protein, partial [Spirochaetaceae bacterium]
MTTTIRRLIIVALGLLAGLAAWPLMETLVHLQSRFPSFLLFTTVSGAVFGLVFGVFFGSAEGIISGNRRRIRQAALVGGSVGLAGG